MVFGARYFGRPFSRRLNSFEGDGWKNWLCNLVSSARVKFVAIESGVTIGAYMWLLDARTHLMPQQSLNYVRLWFVAILFTRRLETVHGVIEAAYMTSRPRSAGTSASTMSSCTKIASAPFGVRSWRVTVPVDRKTTFPKRKEFRELCLIVTLMPDVLTILSISR